MLIKTGCTVFFKFKNVSATVFLNFTTLYVYMFTSSADIVL